MPWIDGRWYDTDPFGVEENKPLNPPAGWTPPSSPAPAPYSGPSSFDQPGYGPVAIPPSQAAAASAYAPYAQSLGLRPGIAESAGPFPIEPQPVFGGSGTGNTYGLTVGGPGQGFLDPQRWAQITAAEEMRLKGNPTVTPPMIPRPGLPSTPPPAPSPVAPPASTGVGAAAGGVGMVPGTGGPRGTATQPPPARGNPFDNFRLQNYVRSRRTAEGAQPMAMRTAAAQPGQSTSPYGRPISGLARMAMASRGAGRLA